MSAEVITPKVSVFFDGEADSFSPSRVVMSLQAGGISTCTVYGQAVSVRGGEAKVVNMLEAEIAERIGKLQTYLYTPRVAPDCSVFIHDGQGGICAFEGYFSNPAYSNSAGSTGSSRTIVHKSAILSAFRGYIYGTTRKLREIMAGGGPLEGIEDPNMATRTAKILEAIIKSWDENRPTIETMDKMSLEILFNQHEQNQNILPVLLDVLNSSDITYVSAEKLKPKDQTDLNGYIAKNIILAQNSSFLENLSMFGQAFQATMIPNLSTSGPYAEFIPNRSFMEDAGPLTLKFIDINYSGGDRRMSPLSNVVIQNYMGPSLRSQVGVSQANAQEMRVYAYPELPIAAGDILYDSGPPWLSPITLGATDTNQAAQTVVDCGLSIDDWKSGKAALNKFGIMSNDMTHMPVIKEWARNLYTYAALEGSAANLGCPLTVPMVPGYRYDVSNSDGRKLLSGFLQQVTHSITVDSRPPSANTVLSFSHIEAGGFKLPYTAN
jgi:hypothetical protein